jgi:hypothetical protein
LVLTIKHWDVVQTIWLADDKKGGNTTQYIEVDNTSLWEPSPTNFFKLSRFIQ